MGKKRAAPKRVTTTDPSDSIPFPLAEAAKRVDEKPSLRKLVVKNLRCIGPTPVEIDLDDIVVLVGPNNVGKSTILRAYELAMSEGSKSAQLSLEDFPGREVNPECLPEIELHTIYKTGARVSEKWKESTAEGFLVKERWQWKGENEKPVRQGYLVAEGKWGDPDADGVPVGLSGVAKAYRPLPHRIEAFASPEEQAKQIVNLLTKVMQDKIKKAKAALKSGDSSPGIDELKTLIEQMEAVQAKFVEESRLEIERVEQAMTKHIGEVFKGYKVEFDPKEDDGLEDGFKFFGAGAELRMGPDHGYLCPISHQGSGARRTMMWAALHYIAENEDALPGERAHLLLLDEPEICMHPNAVRSACKVLYDLPRTGNWQVMVTTHSPAFIDFSRDNTTIVRVSRGPSDEIRSTTVFRPKAAKFDESEKANLKLLNVCDPYVAEFFFGGISIIVEGDTEYTAFNYVRERLNLEPARDLHIIRARGKVLVALLAKILNQFGAEYAILHDSDMPTIKRRNGRVMANPAWSVNEKILEQAKLASGRARLVASIVDFEHAIFGDEAKEDKPYNALLKLRDNPQQSQAIGNLLNALCDGSTDLPKGFIEWNDIEVLKKTVSNNEH